MTEVSPELAFQSLSDSELRRQWDHRMADVQTLAKEGDVETKCYVVKSTIPMVANRDVLVRQESARDPCGPGTFAYAFSSCEHEGWEPKPGHVVASNHFTGYKFSPAPEVNGTWMEWIQNLDVNGSIPAFVFRYAGEQM